MPKYRIVQMANWIYRVQKEFSSGRDFIKNGTFETVEECYERTKEMKVEDAECDTSDYKIISEI